MKQEYCKKVSGFLDTFLEKEGYRLLKTEFVLEDGVYYLRVYIDLSEEEKDRRMAEIRESGETETGKPEAEESADSEAGLPEGAELSGSEGEDEDVMVQEPMVPGIGINDCANVSRRLSKWLDKEDFIAETYMLEVCSKGYLTAEE